jgi:hypothetical protein
MRRKKSRVDRFALLARSLGEEAVPETVLSPKDRFPNSEFQQQFLHLLDALSGERGKSAPAGESALLRRRCHVQGSGVHRS